MFARTLVNRFFVLVTNKPRQSTFQTSDVPLPPYQTDDLPGLVNTIHNSTAHPTAMDGLDTSVTTLLACKSISTSQDSLLDPSTETLSHTPISSHQTLSFSLPPSSEIVEPPEIIKPPENTVTATQMSFEKISSTPLTPTASTMQNMMKNEFAKLHARIDQAISTQIVPNKHLSLPERPEWVTHFADRLEDVYRLLKTNSKNIAKLEARLDQRTPDVVAQPREDDQQAPTLLQELKESITKANRDATERLESLERQVQLLHSREAILTVPASGIPIPTVQVERP
ncbi:Protein of unknown function, partial [Cotesia congregata]